MIPHAEDYKNERDINFDIEHETRPKAKWYDQVLLNRPIKVVFGYIILALLVPILIYQFLFFSSYEIPPSDDYSIGSCILARRDRIPCGLGNVPAEQCHAHCCYDLHSHFCFHRLPSRFSYLVTGPWEEEAIMRPRIPTVPFSNANSVGSLRLSIDEVSPTHMSIAYYKDKYQALKGRRIEDKQYSYEVTGPELNIEVYREDINVFNNLRGPLIAADDIWEIHFRLTEDTMYGFGEIPLTQTVKMISSNKGTSGSVPLIFAKSNQTYHGLLIETKAPTEMNVLENNNIILRSITREGIKLHLFMGPKPEDIMNDVIKLIGRKETLEYWNLGHHYCGDEMTPNEVRDFVRMATRDLMAIDSHCGTNRLVFHDQCSEDKVNVDRGGQNLRDLRKKFMPHVSPYIKFQHTNDTSINPEPENRPNNTCIMDTDDFDYFVLRAPIYDEENYTTSFYVGLADGESVAYPDYDMVTKEDMEKMFVYETSILDGVILENNWPLDESYKMLNETYLYLPYFTENFQEVLKYNPQWNATYLDDENYINRHNEYGNNFVTSFVQLFDADIPTFSTSQFMNGVVGVNRQNVNTTWTDLRNELIAAALGGISGHWFWSSPICGDTDFFNIDIHASLCVKWYMAGTYFPMPKVQSHVTERDALAFVGTHRNLIFESLNRRQMLLPYFYTTLQKGPMLRPMFYQFPSVDSLSDVSTQFSVGESLLIVPNLQPDQSHVHVWMPPGPWYEIWSGLKLVADVGEAVTMTTTEADFLTLIRGGSIIAMNKPALLMADETRLRSPFSLTIAMECITESLDDPFDPTATTNITNCEAQGSIYMTPNMTLNFKADNETLTITPEGNSFVSICEGTAIWVTRITELLIYGLDSVYNNFDNYLRLQPTIDICELTTADEIVYQFGT